MTHRTNTPRADLPVYILAGGRSARFGSDKARALVGETPLILAQARALTALGHDVTVVARTDGQYDDLGLRTIGDIEPDHGPLGGLRTALAHRGRGWLVLTSCDLLEVRTEWLDALTSLRSHDSHAHAVAFRDDRWQPFPGLYHTRLLQREAPWVSGSLQRLLDGARTLVAPAPTPAIRQANTRADLP